MSYFEINQTLIQRLKTEIDKIVPLLLSDTLNGRRAAVERRLRDALSSIFVAYFEAGAMENNLVVKSAVKSLVSALKVPLKYNLELIKRIRGTSVFTGYYNQRYASSFARSEIDRLKRAILKGAYSVDVPTAESEQALANQAMEALKVTRRRAQLLARNEVQRLKEAVNEVYADNPEVMRLYDHKWFNRGSNVRPEHQRMAGLKKGEDGYFHSPDIGQVKGPGMSGIKSFDIGCKCYTQFVKKQGVV